MRSGKLDRTIRLDRATGETVDDYGTPGQTWEALATLRAQIIQASTDEFIRNGAVDETIVVFRTRWLDGVITADTIVYQGNRYNIKETKEIGRREGLELRCQRLA